MGGDWNPLGIHLQYCRHMLEIYFGVHWEPIGNPWGIHRISMREKLRIHWGPIRNPWEIRWESKVYLYEKNLESIWIPLGIHRNLYENNLITHGVAHWESMGGSTGIHFGIIGNPLGINRKSIGDPLGIHWEFIVPLGIHRISM